MLMASSNSSFGCDVQAERAAQEAADEAARRQAAAEARKAAQALKDRKREEVYALNKVLAMCDKARMELFVKAEAEAQRQQFNAGAGAATGRPLSAASVASGAGEAQRIHGV